MKRGLSLFVILVLVLCLVPAAFAVEDNAAWQVETVDLSQNPGQDSSQIITTPMYRLYNPNSGEHFYTGSVQEKDNLVVAGWAYEGVAWNAPINGGTPVYRVYEPTYGDHHYTMSWDEVEMLVGLGWKYEGVCWNSAGTTGIPLHRLWNPNAAVGSHHYTNSEEERDNLVSIGWVYEGIGWFGVGEHEHTYGITKVNGSCTTDGYDRYTCSDCGYTYRTGFIKATGHEYGQKEILVQVDCTTEGQILMACINCDDSYIKYIPALGHNYGQKEVIAQLDCTTDGQVLMVCTNCQDSYIQTTPALGHQWVNATCTTAKYCAVCNQTEGNPSGHTPNAKSTCDVCGQSLNIRSVLSAPLDTMEQIRSFVSYYYAKECYSGGNFRFIFNSVDGVILSWGATNNSSKTIKSITYTVNYYDEYGNAAYDEINGKSSVTYKLTAEIGAGKSFYLRDLIGYGADIYYGSISNMKIEYTDGTTISGNYGYTMWHNIRSTGSPKECFIVEE